MKTLLSFIILVYFSFSSSRLLAGSTLPEPSATSPKELAQAIADYFSRLPQTFQFSSLLEYRQFDAAGAPVKEYPFGYLTTGDYSYLQDGFRYYITDHSQIANNAARNRSIIAYDGHLYQRLRLGDQQLYIQHNVAFDQRPSEYFLRYANPLLLAWEFASSQVAKNDFGADLGVWELRSKTLAETLIPRIRKVDVENGRDGQEIVAEIAAGSEAITKQPSVYRVHFLPARGMFPVMWERYDENGRLIFRYAVEQLGQVTDANGQPLLVPVASKREFFGGVPARPSRDLPYWQIAYKITNIDMAPKVEDEDFTIDPALAKTIYDSDQHVLIDVPN